MTGVTSSSSSFNSRRSWQLDLELYSIYTVLSVDSAIHNCMQFLLVSRLASLVSLHCLTGRTFARHSYMLGAEIFRTSMRSI